MNKIPLGQTIAFSYAFLVTEIWTVLRICRIPALLVVAVDYLWRRQHDIGAGIRGLPRRLAAGQTSTNDMYFVLSCDRHGAEIARNAALEQTRLLNC